jgi:hypothetical protein
MKKLISLSDRYQASLLRVERLRRELITDFALEQVRIIPSLAFNLRSLAVEGFLLNGDATLFRVRMTEGVKLMLSVFESYDQGINVDASYVSMTNFYWGLDALVGGDINLGKSFFNVIGGRTKVEQEHNSKFMSAIGYASKELILHGRCSSERLNELKKRCDKPSVSGYAVMIEGISIRDVKLVEQSIQMILKGHSKLVGPGGLFAMTPLCLWAIGLLNFSSLEGMKVSVPQSQLLPMSLLGI